MVLFSVRKAVQDSLGHSVRGPLKMLKEDMLSVKMSDKMNVLDYVSKFRERLYKAWLIARCW